MLCPICLDPNKAVGKRQMMCWECTKHKIGDTFVFVEQNRSGYMVTVSDNRGNDYPVFKEIDAEIWAYMRENAAQEVSYHRNLAHGNAEVARELKRAKFLWYARKRAVELLKGEIGMDSEKELKDIRPELLPRFYELVNYEMANIERDGIPEEELQVGNRCDKFDHLPELTQFALICFDRNMKIILEESKGKSKERIATEMRYLVEDMARQGRIFEVAIKLMIKEHRNDTWDRLYAPKLSTFRKADVVLKKFDSYCKDNRRMGIEELAKECGTSENTARKIIKENRADIYDKYYTRSKRAA